MSRGGCICRQLCTYNGLSGDVDRDVVVESCGADDVVEGKRAVGVREGCLGEVEKEEGRNMECVLKRSHALMCEGNCLGF